MDLQLTDHTTVIVGGANGIGLAIAHAFAAERSNVAILDIAADVAETASAIAEAEGDLDLGRERAARTASANQKRAMLPGTQTPSANAATL